MTKDHYVARTYLRQFSLDGKEGFVNAVRKKNLERLEVVPVGSICYEKNGSDNPYFPDNPRVIEDYLRLYEPRWVECVRKISQGIYTNETKLLMAGYIAYLRMCTPTAMRLGQELLADVIKPIYDSIEKKEYLNPDSKHREAIEIIRQHGGIKIEVDKKYPTALGITNLFNIQATIMRSPWIIFRNETTIPLLTSDNPVCLQYHPSGFADFYCPITPWLAIVIHPIRDKGKGESDYITFFKPDGVEKMNRLVVQSAEDIVICKNLDTTEQLVKRFQDWRVELKKVKIPLGKRHLIVQQQKPVKRKLNEVGVNQDV